MKLNEFTSLKPFDSKSEIHCEQDEMAVAVHDGGTATPELAWLNNTICPVGEVEVELTIPQTTVAASTAIALTGRPAARTVPSTETAASFCISCLLS